MQLRPPSLLPSAESLARVERRLGQVSVVGLALLLLLLLLWAKLDGIG